MSHAGRILAALGLAGLVSGAGIVGCRGDNELSGSVSELFPITDVSRVEVRRNPEALQVSYFRNNGLDVDLVARLTVDTEGVDLKPGTKVQLGGTTPSGRDRASVVHVAAGEPARVFTPVERGDLVLDEGGNPDQPTRGDFSLSFKKGDGYGAGRSLEGTFSATALDAGFGPDLGDVVGEEPAP
ncbi:hypothetical protein [Corallococcus terminator]|uniref:Lipoprotein n=1 Tax=Corallococcus terminator TaxID=2316733 RepID=A0A3A8HPQ3_9BACT|nr:hypothetical protein [Corallococcus terminator]RKG73269.1 hypothetical protein D7V88_36720 [Corallococcus terminator]